MPIYEINKGQIIYYLNPNIKTPLHLQLFEQLKNDILKNYQINEKLPSLRKLALEYNLSKNTVQTAYSQLVAEGYVDSIPKSGYYVIQTGLVDFHSKFSEQVTTETKKNEILFDFFPARLEKNSFPIKVWKRLFNKNINDTLDFGDYKNKQGEITLRVQIAKYLNKSRAVSCTENQIIIGSGFADCLSLLALLLKNKHHILAMEEPGYQVAKKVFESHNYSIDKIDVNKQGIDIEKLKKSKAKLVYLTPSNQYPTGVSIPISNRLKLLAWASKNAAFIIEDDYDSELSYNNRPLPSLQGLKENQRVVYIGTFSKALSPSIRVSYMVLPNTLLERYKNKFSYYTCGVSFMIQKTLSAFLEKGYWDRHLRKMRTQNKKKHKLLKSLLEQKLKDSVEIISQGGGLSITIRARKNLDLKKLEKLSSKEKIPLYFTKPRCGGKYEGLMMGFGGIKEENLEKAVELFSKIWFESIL